MAAPAPKEGGGMGAIFSKKVGGIPVILIVAVVGYILYKRMGSSSSSSSTGTAGTMPPTASLTLPGGYSYSGPASGAAAFQQTVGQAPSPGNSGPGTTAVTPGNTGLTGLQGEPQIGVGYGNPAGVGPGQPIVTSGGSFYGLQSPQQGAAITSASQPLYAQVQPGQFLSNVNTQGQATPLYYKGQ